MIFTIVSIISVILIIYNIILYTQNKKRKQRLDENIASFTEQQLELEAKIARLNKQASEISNIQEEKYKIQQQLNKKIENLTNQYNKSNNDFQEYQNKLKKQYEQSYHQTQHNIALLEQEQNQIQSQISKLKSSLTAAAAAQLREEQKKDKIDFYSIQLSEEQKQDIKQLLKIRHTFHDPTIVSKIIWSTYILNPTSSMCNRVLGKNPICGIYKITNKENEKCYIGQSVNIADRWKTHIKKGLGIEAPASNKLYNAMQNAGVFNFTFELLEECPRNLLNEKQAFWIDMYQANILGYNGTIGVKKK